MKNLTLRFGFVSVGTMILLPLLPSYAQVLPVYQITDIGTLSSSGGSSLSWINNQGQVSGTRETGGYDRYERSISHAFVWDSVHGMTDLGTLGGDNSSGFGINDQGQIVGIAQQSSGVFSGFVWQQGQLTATPYWGSAVNDSGQVVGTQYGISGLTPGTAVRVSSGMEQNLGTLGGINSYGRGIDTNGEAVGSAELNLQSGLHHAFFWSPTSGIVDLDPSDSRSSDAYSVNNRGQVVGISDLYGAMLWQGGKAISLGGLGPESGAFSINSAGQIVGFGPDVRGFTSAMLWQNGQEYNLNTLAGAPSGWNIGFADSINDRGQIVCSASRSYGFGPIHALLLTPIIPVSEPGSTALLVGMIGIGTLLRRKRRQT